MSKASRRRENNYRPSPRETYGMKAKVEHDVAQMAKSAEAFTKVVQPMVEAFAEARALARVISLSARQAGKATEMERQLRILWKEETFALRYGTGNLPVPTFEEWKAVRTFHPGDPPNEKVIQIAIRGES